MCALRTARYRCSRPLPANPFAVLCICLGLAVTGTAAAAAITAAQAAEPVMEPAVLVGRVIEADTGQPLVGANVYQRDGTAGTVSVTGGYFTISDLPAAGFTLVVTYVGFEPAIVPVSAALLAAGEEMSIALQPTIYAGEEIVVTASRYGSDVHLTHTNLTRQEIEKRQTDADIPLLLEDIPGLYARSDPGNGLGYTYLNIRGFDQKRVGVLIDGIPLNDPEDHQVYWVDPPDFASSLEDVQVQRGVTNSVGGLTTLGGTVNMVTEQLPVQPEGRLTLQSGSYGTNKQMLSYKSGLLGGRFSSGLRVTHQESDGFRQRAGSDQWSVFWGLRYITATTSTQFNLFTGREVTQQAFDASPEMELASDPNAVDNFQQPHVHLHHDWDISDAVKLRNSLFYIHGEGYFENFKEDRTAEDFSLDVFLGLNPDDEVNLVRRKWVRKDQVGWVPTLTVAHAGGRLNVGGDVYTFHSNHWGDVIDVEGFTPDDMVDGLKYYDYTGDKDVWSAYLNERYNLTGTLTLLLDLQYQHRQYEFLQNEVGNFTGTDRNAYRVDYDFFNPKGGFFWRWPGGVAGNEMGFYGNVGVAHREPADDDLFDTFQGPDDLGVQPLFNTSREVLATDGMTVQYVEWSDPIVQPEKVVDYEVGATFRGGRVSLTLNGYWMDFENEIVPFGTVDDDGFAVKGNAEKTLHRGVELGLVARLVQGHMLYLAASRSWNEFDSFVVNENVYDPDTWEFLGTVPRDMSGNPIPLFPDHMASLRWLADWGALDTTLRVRNVGKQYLDISGIEERTIDPYTLLDLEFGVSLDELGWRGMQGARVDLRLRNLLDEQYETNGYWGQWDTPTQRRLFPAAGRNFLVGVYYRF